VGRSRSRIRVEVRRVGVTDGLAPMPDHGLVHRVGRQLGRAARTTFVGLDLGQEGGPLVDLGGRHCASRARRAMPRPAAATISRCTSLTPPPKVLIWAERPISSIWPPNTAPGDPPRR